MKRNNSPEKKNCVHTEEWMNFLTFKPLLLLQCSGSLPRPRVAYMTQSPKAGMKDNAEGRAVDDLCPLAFITFNLYF